MFGKASRFPAEKPSDIPPPGYYNPKEIDGAPYKRGAFLEKSERKLFDKVPDGPGPSDYQSVPSELKGKGQPRKPSTSTNNDNLLRQEIQELEGEIARLSKERRHDAQQMETKLEQAEARIRELVREKGTLQTEAAVAIKEQRLAQEREVTARIAREKAEKEGKQFAERASKYNALQRRLEELERLHSESKSKSRKHNGTLESDLEQARALVAEQQKELERSRQHQADEERRIQDLKRAHTMAEKDNQELRCKVEGLQSTAATAQLSRAEKKQLEDSLRALESRHAKEVSELQVKLHNQESLIARSKQEVRDRDVETRKTTAELRDVEAKLKRVTDEFEAEKRKRRTEEDHHKDLEKGKIRTYEARIQALQKELADLRSHGSDAKHTIEEERRKASNVREDLQARLEHVHQVMATVAEQYGGLAAAMQKHRRQSSLERVTAEATRIKLEGMVADREGRIRHLASVLQLQDEATVTLLTGLNDYDSLVRSILRQQSTRADDVAVRVLTSSPELDFNAELSWRDELLQMQEQMQRGIEDLLCFDKGWAEKGYNRVMGRLCEVESDSEMARKKLGEEETTRMSAQSALSDAEERLAAANESVTTLKAHLTELNNRAARFEEDSGRIQSSYRADVDKLAGQLNTEKAYAAQLSLELAHGKAREAALAVDVDNLQETLVNVERYKSEYQALLAEVKVILSRNALAEDEAERLSRFNAEILGHQNPMQKILYVDKIRREMADVKQKLIVSTLERDAAEDAKRKLRDELASYKAVDIPLDTKPRSTMTRVARVPFTARNVNTLSKSQGHRGNDRSPTEHVGHNGSSWEAENAGDALRVEDLLRP
ncbi:hypothetical protein CALVIDRAFT_428084 [Calocera viscosa TUFC12733]|uniref:Uncharacterized protein n=1 Tax=Calocera viscosa (strain TUFC12733) TaxID=1330018 RepID=A0A167PM52_CALVF|nr:hypothetical protein CALVIDRAFT_428084 [Calocera viscosa TUFC12733]